MLWSWEQERHTSLACFCSACTALLSCQHPPSLDRFQFQIVVHLHKKSHISDTSEQICPHIRQITGPHRQRTWFYKMNMGKGGCVGGVHNNEFITLENRICGRTTPRQ